MITSLSPRICTRLSNITKYITNRLSSPTFSYNDVKFAESPAVFGRAVDLFTKCKVRDVEDRANGYEAKVAGTHPYHVFVSRKHVDYADCDCYLGQNDTLCKHVLALALYVLHEDGDIDTDGNPIGASRLDPADAKLHISAALRKIRAYDGPSSVWFSYQRKLDVASGMVQEALPLLEPNVDTEISLEARAQVVQEMF